MSESKHTPEPWVVGGPYPGTSVCVVVDHGCGGPCPEPPVWEAVAILDQRTSGEPSPRAQADAERIVACVNACRGINPEAVPELLAALQDCQSVLSMLTNEQDIRATTVTHVWAKATVADSRARSAIAKATPAPAVNEIPKA